MKKQPGRLPLGTRVAFNEKALKVTVALVD
jgi:hypothetical protein